MPGLVLIYYLSDTLGIAALAAGALVTAAKVWDVIIDPVIGACSDASLARTGSRRRFMVLGGLLLPLFFILTFAVPGGLGPTASGSWVLLAFMATATAFSLFQVPYIALPAELTPGYDQRTALLSVRVLVLSLAILLFGACGPALRSLGGEDEALGYLLMALVAGVLIGAAMLLASRVAPTGPIRPVEPSNIALNYRQGYAVLKRSRPFRLLLACFALQGLGTGVMLAGAQYVATWVLRSEGAVTFLFIALIGPAVLIAPICRIIAARIGKERAFIRASALYGVAALALAGMLIAPGAWIYLPVALADAGYAGMQSLPMSMLPDVISHDAATHGQGQAGIFGGVWTAGETTGMALGGTALTLVLAASGYVQSVAGHAARQGIAAANGIIPSFSLVPALFIAISLLVFARYPLRRGDIDTGSAHSNAPHAEGTR
ncbi:MFS transporter [Paeniglutamicibacter cryotolerans]|uniref:Na+/melibiose symporter-like transporter n=1 Tax=Paeniglutamicibacter cryotolerans TaxID=670079 RepID=A0A839QK83_9MICC|nr:MFS transporter [Paeniglutamicibacter cryotolerans]MBB2996808.1 Na+/melibiose symporter-like transporter [Paeniglutamicibacter cryotolerans]